MPARVHTLYRARDLVALTRAYFHPIERADTLDPFRGPRPVAPLLQILQWTKAQGLIVPSYMIMCSSDRLTQRVHAHPFVEAIQGHPRIAPKLRRKHGQMCRFTSGSRTDSY